MLAQRHAPIRAVELVEQEHAERPVAREYLETNISIKRPPSTDSHYQRMKHFAFFLTVTLPLIAPYLPTADLSSTEDAQGSSTKLKAVLTKEQTEMIQQLGFDETTHKIIVDRASSSAVEKLGIVHEFLKKGQATKKTENGEEFELALAYVPCEMAWHLRVIDFDETIQCLEKSTAWNVKTKVGDKMLVNLFADRYGFELKKLFMATGVSEEGTFSNLHRMLSFEGTKASVVPTFFLYHALKLHQEDPRSPSRREMAENFLSLHLSSVACSLVGGGMPNALYTGLALDVSTLFYGGFPNHAITVVATRVGDDKYGAVIINSGAGIKNHEKAEVRTKGFHTGAEYYAIPGFEPPTKATSYNPLLRMSGLTGTHLSLVKHFDGVQDEVYYVAKNLKELVVENKAPMPWEWTESQGIGSCTASSIWYAVRFYYQALAYESGLRLSMLGQAMEDLVELQDKVKDLEYQVNADYQKEWEAFKEAHKDDIRTAPFDYAPKSLIRDARDEKERLEKHLHLRRSIISVALNEILQNVVGWHSELGDIRTGLLGSTKELEPLASSKMTRRRDILEQAIPQSIASFNSFWALQEEKCLRRQDAESREAERSSSTVLDAWYAVRENVQAMYYDTVKTVGLKPVFLESAAVSKKEETEAVGIELSDGDDKYTSLDKVLDYIIHVGNSTALRNAIRAYDEKYKLDASTSYLIVLNACLKKDVPLLNYLIVQNKMPLRYTIDTTKKNDELIESRDFSESTAEDIIAALAAHEFVLHGDPLDVFPELLLKSEGKGIRDVFAKEYGRTAPAAFAKESSQEEIDKAFVEFARQGMVSPMAYFQRKASSKAIKDAFENSDDPKALRFLIASGLIRSSELFKAKIEKNIANSDVVEAVLPGYLGSERYSNEIRALVRHEYGLYDDLTGTSGLATFEQSAGVTLPNDWLRSASAKDAVKVMGLLAQYSSRSAIDGLLSEVAKSGKDEQAHLLVKYATSEAILAASKEANSGGHEKLRKALREVYTLKAKIDNAFLEAAMKGDLDALEKTVLDASQGAVEKGLLAAAQSGHMDCFELLVPYSTGESINKALFVLPGKNWKHPSVSKAIAVAVNFLDFRKLLDRKQAASLLPFIPMDMINSFFEAARKDKEYAIVEQLFPFVSPSYVDSYFKSLVEEGASEQIRLVLPRVSRGKVDQTLELEGLGASTREILIERKKAFPMEISVMLAFLPKEKENRRQGLKDELSKYGSGLKCTDASACVEEMKKMAFPSSLAFTIEQLVPGLVSGNENEKLKQLLPFATAYACSEIVSGFSAGGSQEAVRFCAKKVHKDDVRGAVFSALFAKETDLAKFLLPYLSPQGMVSRLRGADSQDKIHGCDVAEVLLDSFSKDFFDDALRIASREEKGKREKLVRYLVPKASQAAIDEVYLFAKHIGFSEKALEEKASDKAKEQGKRIEDATSALKT